MASKLAYLTLAVAILVAVALHPAAAGGDDGDHHNDNVYDCLAKFGPGCTECINITVTHNPHRRLLSGYATARQLRSDGDHDDNDDHDTGVNRTILVCAQCDAGYRLDPEDDFVLENGAVVGECGKSFLFFRSPIGMLQSMPGNCSLETTIATDCKAVFYCQQHTLSAA